MLAGLAAATIVGHEEARLEGVLLSARTAQHEVNNRLSLVRATARSWRTIRTCPDELQHPAQEIVRASRAAAEILAQARQAGRAARGRVGPGLRPTLDLGERPGGATCTPRIWPIGADNRPTAAISARSLDRLLVGYVPC